MFASPCDGRFRTRCKGCALHVRFSSTALKVYYYSCVRLPVAPVLPSFVPFDSLSFTRLHCIHVHFTMKLTSYSILFALASTIAAAPVPGATPITTPTSTLTAVPCTAATNADVFPFEGTAEPGDDSEAAGSAASEGTTQANQRTSEITKPGAAQDSSFSSACSDHGKSASSVSSGAGSGGDDGVDDTDSNSSASAGVTNPDAVDAQSDGLSNAVSRTMNTPLGPVSVSSSAAAAAAADANGDDAASASSSAEMDTPLTGPIQANATAIESVGQAVANADSTNGDTSNDQPASSSGQTAATGADAQGAPSDTTGTNPDTSDTQSQSLDNPNGDAGAVAASGGSPSGSNAHAKSEATGNGANNNAAAGNAGAAPNGAGAGTGAS
ncbi:hypothetical protein BDY17DRAFT_160696 [Neohortaea acidophila]|uniref:Uncharacterized protein n=1 Tax=Neohortaea acidophila TaxID=245834 RepID=A0A6A6PR62_9PEZI|nr:uncharacterized protein BDY17DRAFT_160696 [Neohortaea acidophila]KAF2482472.1 hypothetical protein BDY17DRAFT_160696 [Neohortaea acidophila]